MTNNKQFANKTPLKFGLIGNPISHSKSPALFSAAYTQYPFTYQLIEADTIEKAMDRFFTEGFTGANVTAPFKDSIFKYITHPDRISTLLKSANIIIRKGEELHSYNSDYYGVKNTIEPIISYINKTQKIKKALVIGAGGAGKAASLALKDMGIKTLLANRSANKVIEFINTVNTSANESTVQTPDIEYISLHQIPIYATDCQLIIYSLSFKLEEMEKVSLCKKIMFEANYANAQFLPKNITQINNQTDYIYVSGKHWLYNQAIPAFRIFTTVEPDTDAMKKIIGL